MWSAAYRSVGGLAELASRRTVAFRWVKAHNGDLRSVERDDRPRREDRPALLEAADESLDAGVRFGAPAARNSRFARSRRPSPPLSPRRSVTTRAARG